MVQYWWRWWPSGGGDGGEGYIYIYISVCLVSVLLSLSVERFSVSRMHNFLSWFCDSFIMFFFVFYTI